MNNDSRKKRIAYLCSGNGAITECCVNFINQTDQPAENAIIITDRECEVLEKAKKYEIPTITFSTNWQTDSENLCDQILEVCQSHQIELLFLQFNHLLTGKILKEYENKIINLHLSLLPAFKGFNAIEAAINHGCKFIGATTHFTTSKTDAGPIIAQGIIPISPLQSLEEIKHLHFQMLKKLSLETIYAFINDKIDFKSMNIVAANYQSILVNPSNINSPIESFLATYN